MVKPEGGVAGERPARKRRKEAIVSPWLETAYDVQNVVTVEEATGLVKLGGTYLTENQTVTLKSEAQVFAKFTMLPLLLDTVRREAVEIGLNKATCFDHTLTAKAMMLTVDWLKGLIRTFERMKIQPKK